jgi:hypothetical protein
VYTIYIRLNDNLRPEFYTLFSEGTAWKIRPERKHQKTQPGLLHNKRLAANLAFKQFNCS